MNATTHLAQYLHLLVTGKNSDKPLEECVKALSVFLDDRRDERKRQEALEKQRAEFASLGLHFDPERWFETRCHSCGGPIKWIRHTMCSCFNSEMHSELDSKVLQRCKSCGNPYAVKDDFLFASNEGAVRFFSKEQSEYLSHLPIPVQDAISPYLMHGLHGGRKEKLDRLLSEMSARKDLTSLSFGDAITLTQEAISSAWGRPDEKA